MTTEAGLIAAYAAWAAWATYRYAPRPYALWWPIHATNAVLWVVIACWRAGLR